VGRVDWRYDSHVYPQRNFLFTDTIFEVDETVQITTTEASQLSGNLYEDPRDGFAAGYVGLLHRG
jgi:hypothetical protein